MFDLIYIKLDKISRGLQIGVSCRLTR